MKIELGLTSFAENSDIVMPDGKHESISHAQRIRNIVEEIELADQLGLDIYGLGEHHRKDYAVSGSRNSFRRCSCKNTAH